MQLADLLDPHAIKFELEERDKESVLDEIAQLLKNAGRVASKHEFLTSVYEREQHETTGVGDGIGIPHGISPAVKELSLAFSRSTPGVEFNAIDGKKAHLLFMTAAPPKHSEQVADVLKALSKMLVKGKCRQELMEVDKSDDVIKIFRKYSGD